MSQQAYLQSSRYPFLRLLSYLRESRRDYLLATLYSVLNKLFDIFPEILIGGAVDIVVNHQNSWVVKWIGVEDISLAVTVARFA